MRAGLIALYCRTGAGNRCRSARGERRACHCRPGAGGFCRGSPRCAMAWRLLAAELGPGRIRLASGLGGFATRPGSLTPPSKAST